MLESLKDVDNMDLVESIKKIVDENIFLVPT